MSLLLMRDFTSLGKAVVPTFMFGLKLAELLSRNQTGINRDRAGKTKEKNEIMSLLEAHSFLSQLLILMQLLICTVRPRAAKLHLAQQSRMEGEDEQKIGGTHSDALL